MIIGGIELNGPLSLAPLAGITSLPVREFFSSHGAALTHTEMISSSGLIRDNAKTLDMLRTSELEAPLIVQLFGNDEAVLVSGGKVVMRSCDRFSGFGINMACPMPKVTRNGSGAALLKKPDTAMNMTRGLKALGLPVWVKIRKLENNYDTLKFIEGLIDSGADNVCIHGRTCAQRYEGISDRNITSLAAGSFPGYISASGDVKTLNDIHEYFNMGCVSVMIARGAFMNPFMFEEFNNIFRDKNERLDELIKFSDRAYELSGEHKALVLMKRFAGSILRNYDGSAEMRRQAMTSTNLDEIIKVLRKGNVLL